MKSVSEMQRANEKRRTGDSEYGNNSFPGKVKEPARAEHGTMDDSGEAKAYPKTGDGDFAELENKLAHEKGVTDPAGLAAKIGIEKLGKGEFERRAEEGRKHA